jgi:hypothetical protein
VSPEAHRFAEVAICQPGEKRFATEDSGIQEVMDVINRLMKPARSRRSKIGFALPQARIGQSPVVRMRAESAFLAPRYFMRLR